MGHSETHLLSADFGNHGVALPWIMASNHAFCLPRILNNTQILLSFDRLLSVHCTRRNKFAQPTCQMGTCCSCLRSHDDGIGSGGMRVSNDGIPESQGSHPPPSEDSGRGVLSQRITQLWKDSGFPLKDDVDSIESCLESCQLFPPFSDDTPGKRFLAE